MSAKILDGKVVRDEIAQNLKLKIENLKLKLKLVIIQIGDLAQSNAYINQKIKFGERIGAVVELKKFPADVTEDTLISQISSLNSDNSVNGIILQMPIPDHLNREKLINSIDPKKDVDGLTITNQELLEENDPKAIIPATPKGVLSLLKFYGIDVQGKKVTVVGRSKLVGAPLATLLRNIGANVTVCHSQTLDLKQETRNAEILMIAVGKPNLITKDHVSPGQAIIDVGINVINLQTADSKQQTAISGKQSVKLTGDVAYAEVEPIVSAITPVPGGIGPMTVASLFENLVGAYKKQVA